MYTQRVCLKGRLTVDEDLVNVAGQRARPIATAGWKYAHVAALVGVLIDGKIARPREWSGRRAVEHRAERASQLLCAGRFFNFRPRSFRRRRIVFPLTSNALASAGTLNEPDLSRLVTHRSFSRFTFGRRPPSADATGSLYLEIRGMTSSSPRSGSRASPSRLVAIQ